MTINHYENFPVASWIMPPKYRPAVRTIYAFARSADDLADEGNLSDDERIEALAEYEKQLDKIAANERIQTPLFQDLQVVIRQHQLPIKPFYDLISAFKQDVVIKEYSNFSTLLAYCQRSANPVGRIMLHLYKKNNATNEIHSDQICTALQLINFWQDVALDQKINRQYIPQEDLTSFNISNSHLKDAVDSGEWQALIQFQIERTRSMMLAGSVLCKQIPGRFGFELRVVVQGGLRILEKLERVDGDMFKSRPRLTKFDIPILLWRAIRMYRT